MDSKLILRPISFSIKSTKLVEDFKILCHLSNRLKQYELTSPGSLVPLSKRLLSLVRMRLLN